MNLRKVHNVRWARSDSNTLTSKGTDLQSVVTLLRYRSPYHKPVVPLNRKIELRLDHNVLTGRYSPLLFNWRRTHLSTSYHRLTSLICGNCWESALTICHLSVEVFHLECSPRRDRDSPIWLLNGSNGIRTRATHVTGGRVNRCTMEPTPLLGVEPRIAERSLL